MCENHFNKSVMLPIEPGFMRKTNKRRFYEQIYFKESTYYRQNPGK